MNSAPLYKEVIDFLTDIIEKNKNPNHKLPSERYLSSRFSASRTTIRNAYNNLIEKGFVKSIHGKGYFINVYYLLTNKPFISTKSIYFIVPDLKTQFSQDILQGITDFCDKNNLDLSIKLTKDDKKKETYYLNNALISKTKGIILFPIDNEESNETLNDFINRKFPVTIIDRYFSNLDFSFVSTDNFNAMINAVAYLHKKNFKNIVYITPDTSVATTLKERLNGYRSGLRKYYNNISANSILVIENKNYDIIARYLEENKGTEVIIITGTKSAVSSVVSAVKSVNKSIPKDIKLMTFDTDFSIIEEDILKPIIIKQDAYNMGYTAASYLYDQIYNDYSTKSIRLSTNIIDHSEQK